ncbi:MAG TPA: hypothetical protein VKU37_06970 [Verrucomicrobiae bacterium]|nr:hypothetical protein [Verrucomicrobiae bacterium]
MSTPARATVAWEPFTPRGVAAFAGAGFGRLLLVQFVAALLAAAAVVWFVDNSCFPVVGTAIQKLPATGEIRSGRLDWPGRSPELLAGGRLLALDVDLDHSGQIGPAADVQIEFGRGTIRSFSLFGYWEWPYPRGYVIAFNRNTLEPLWGAWVTALLVIAGVAATLGVLLNWWLLATLYFLPVWLLGFFTNRDLNFRRSWRLAGAALVPGALLMTAAIVLYGIGFLNLVSFGFIFGAHFLIGWIYLFVSLLFIPPTPIVVNPGNPFRPSQKERE